jgi:uncharacterized coiled-coil DUF342 family protein
LDGAASAASATSDVMATMAQTRNNLLERGEKLREVSDKADSLKNQSEEFANMARLLRESQQKKGFFGW